MATARDGSPARTRSRSRSRSPNRPLAPISEMEAQSLYENGVPPSLVRHIGLAMRAIDHYKRQDAGWTTAVLRETLQDTVDAFTRMIEVLDVRLAETPVNRTPPDDERRELLHLISDAARNIPKASVQIIQNRLELAWLDPHTLPLHAQPQHR
ncbi:unnamed protein product [Symbiodinium sp. CCMP2592]|nr:unnamed protein product [Symbiodinium sp. CCMP2592]